MPAVTQKSLANSVAINWGDKNSRFGERLALATDYLEFKARLGNAVEAYKTVERIVSESRKFELYKRYFPDEWRASRASFVRRGFYFNYSERANEFFALVGERLFPLFAGWNDDPETDFEEFSIFSLNIDFCCADVEYEYISLAYALGLLLFTNDEEIWEFFEKNYKVRRKNFPEINDSAHENLWRGVRNSKVEPYLNLLEIIDHTTGNPWFDTSSCCVYGDTFDWSEQTIDLLTNSFRKAKRMLDEMDELDTLIKNDPEKMLKRLITFWNDGFLPDD